MNEKMLRKVLIAVALLLVGALSFMFLADTASSPVTHEKTIVSIDEKVENVLKLSASSAVASAVISSIPGDTATPIADKLAEFSQYFLLILCVLYAEKYLLTIAGAVAFRVLIPLACALFIAALFWRPEIMKRIGAKLVIFAVVLYVAIPLSIQASDVINNTYEASISNTIESTEELSDELSGLAGVDSKDQGLVSRILNSISETASSLTDKAASLLNSFIETLAVVIVTSCIIPILALVFIIWLIKLLTGIEIPFYPPRRPEALPEHEED